MVLDMVWGKGMGVVSELFEVAVWAITGRTLGFTVDDVSSG